MNFFDLPNELLIHIFRTYCSAQELICLSLVCKKLKGLLDTSDLAWSKHLSQYPLIDDSSSNITTTPNRTRFINYFELIDRNRYLLKCFLKFRQKMMPHLQVVSTDNSKPMIYLTDLDHLVRIQLTKVHHHVTSQQRAVKKDQTTSRKHNYNYRVREKPMHIAPEQNIHLGFNGSRGEYITGFAQKEDTLVAFSTTQVRVCLNDVEDGGMRKKKAEFRPSSSNSRTVYTDFGSKINCVDFLPCESRLVCGTSSGKLSLVDMMMSSENKSERSANRILVESNVGDRILRCQFAPSHRFLAVGTAGINKHKSPVRILDVESSNCLREVQTLTYNNTSINTIRRHDNYFNQQQQQQQQQQQKLEFRYGAGVLALSYMDDNTVMAAGYDTFIRIFDLRSNKCVQALEDPEDMSVYCVCCTSQNGGLLSGLDRFGLIRYWDRRANNIIKSFNLEKSCNSPVYSLACTPRSIYGSWEQGVSVIDFG